jgi:hypothetical protein
VATECLFTAVAWIGPGARFHLWTHRIVCSPPLQHNDGIPKSKGDPAVKLGFILLLFLGFITLAQAQTGPCTEESIRKGQIPIADDAFSYMPPYGRPVIGNAGMKEANRKSFSDRTNIQRSWEDDHHVVTTPAGDMAYEYGTLRMSYDSKSAGHQEFEAVMLLVYKAKDNKCEQAALTMQPLEPQKKN